MNARDTYVALGAILNEMEEHLAEHWEAWSDDDPDFQRLEREFDSLT